MEERIKAFVSTYQKQTKYRKYNTKNLKRRAMIKEVCNDLKNALLSDEPLALFDTVAGLAQTLTYKSPDENGNSTTKRMPVSYDTNIANGCQQRSKEKALVPNSKSKGILYFEDSGNGVQLVRLLSGGRGMYRAQVTLVAWLNRRNSVGDTYAEVGKLAYDEIINKLKGTINSSLFLNLKAQPIRFKQDASVFNKYTYDETALQFLRPPFEFFTIDFTVSFISKCNDEITLNPATCETLDLTVEEAAQLLNKQRD